jgi:integrase
MDDHRKFRPLTKRTVDALQPGATAWDAAVRGFGVRRQAGEDRTFYVKFRVGRGRSARQRWYKIGVHGSPWTVETARTEAKRVLGDVARGLDPAATRDEAKAAITLEAFASRYLAEHAEPRKKASSIEMDRLNLRVHVLPALGKHLLANITRADVAKFMHDMRGTPGAANRCCALLSKMMNLAEKWGARPDGTNPCRHVEKYPEHKRKRFLSPAELAALGAALEALDTGTGVARYFVALVRLLIFTGSRLDEIRTARWEWFDENDGVLRLPDSKTGAKSIMIPAPALAVLAELPRVDGNPYIIAGIGAKPLVNAWAHWSELREKAGLTDVRMHDLRHTFASTGAASNMSLSILGALLGHSRAETTQRYAHLATDPLKAAADRIGSALEAAMNSKDRKVVRLLRPSAAS